MNARKRQQMLRVMELAKKHPSFANNVGVSAFVKETHTEGNGEENVLRKQRAY